VNGTRTKRLSEVILGTIYTSHAADSFRMMAIAWRENKPKEVEKPDVYAIKGAKYGIQTVSLDKLWAEYTKNNRTNIRKPK